MAKTKTMDVVVKPGRTLSLGEARESGGKPARPKVTRHGPGAELTLETSEAERLIDKGVLARRGTEEAAAAQRIADTIPASFPGQEDLAKAGIETFSALRSAGDLTELDGIGEATAKKIAEELKKLDAEG